MTDELADIAAPNCPVCLHPMDAVIGAWWCPRDGTTVRPEDETGSEPDPTV